MVLRVPVAAKSLICSSNEPSVLAGKQQDNDRLCVDYHHAKAEKEGT